MNNLLGHATESLSIRGIKGKEGHHHMSKIIGTHTNEDHWQDYKYPIFHENLIM